jgi:hypothetical protein
LIPKGLAELGCSQVLDINMDIKSMVPVSSTSHLKIVPITSLLEDLGIMASTHSVDKKHLQLDDAAVTTENIDNTVDYTHNVNAKIVNPLAGIPRDTLRLKVDAFCESWGFQAKRDIFWKGALAAQNPSTVEELSELEEEDKYHIRREFTHRWHLPKDLYFAIAICSLGSAVQGWDNTGANGANLSFPQVRIKYSALQA